MNNITVIRLLWRLYVWNNDSTWRRTRQGSDSGAVYKSRKEKDDTLRLTRAVGQILENSGINVYYVREDDEYETPFKKATDANNAGADYFVSIHRNSSERPNQYNGVETLVYNDSGIKAVLARNINEELEKAALKISV